MCCWGIASWLGLGFFRRRFQHLSLRPPRSRFLVRVSAANPGAASASCPTAFHSATGPPGWAMDRANWSRSSAFTSSSLALSRSVLSCHVARLLSPSLRLPRLDQHSLFRSMPVVRLAFYHRNQSAPCSLSPPSPNGGAAPDRLGTYLATSTKCRLLVSQESSTAHSFFTLRLSLLRKKGSVAVVYVHTSLSECCCVCVRVCICSMRPRMCYCLSFKIAPGSGFQIIREQGEF